MELTLGHQARGCTDELCLCNGGRVEPAARQRARAD